jgi:hypothetical protein
MTKFKVQFFWALVLAMLPGARAALLSDPAVDQFNCRMSTTMIGGGYQFTTNNILVEGAQVLTNLGINSYKFTLNSTGGGYITLPSNITNLMLEARDVAPFRNVFDMPTLKHYVFWCYTFANPGNASWNTGFTNTLKQTKEYNEIYALAQYFLTNYNNSGKSFYLGHWEGDWSTGLSTSGTTTNNPSPTALQGMINWLNIRQKAVDDAMANVPHTNVNVYLYCEVNRVLDTVNDAPPYTNRVINCVVPYVTNLDFVSWSAYDLQDQTNVAGWLDYANSFIPTNKAAKIAGRRLFIGEFGWGNLTEDVQAPLIQAFDQTLFSWGCPFSFYWQLYDNETNADGSFQHLDLIYTNGAPTANYWLYAWYWNAAKLQVLAFKQQQGRLPTDSEFNDLASAILSSPITEPVSLSATAGAPRPIGPGTAALQGTLTQGIYGDPGATVKLYWGPKDGAKKPADWAHSVDLGVNTNAGVVAYAPVVTNLPGTYYFRYQATNLYSNAWSKATYVQTTLNPADYGSRMQVTFSGYNRSSTLTNFPVLVRLTPGVGGFSYAQFASASGGDLRFADASGSNSLPFEIDEWNTNGTSLVWVRVPILSGPGNSIWALWGNAAATNVPASSTDGEVWSDNYALVWHLKETNFPYADSTQVYPGTTGTAPGTSVGVIGSSANFQNNSSSYISAGSVNFSNTFTLSAWVNVTNTANSIQTIWANKTSGGGNGFSFYVNGYNTSDQSLVLETSDGTHSLKAKTGTNLVTFGQWHFVSAVVDQTAGTASLYVDGVDQTAAAGVEPGFDPTLPVNLGRFATNSGTPFYFRGLLDEARMANTARSPDWIWASYATSATNSSLAAYANVVRNHPQLNIQTDAAGHGGSLVFNWPASGVGFALQTATNLATPVAWTALTNAPMLITTNGVTQWQISLSPDANTMRYYRLWSP